MATASTTSIVAVYPSVFYHAEAPTVLFAGAVATPESKVWLATNPDCLDQAISALVDTPAKAATGVAVRFLALSAWWVVACRVPRCRKGMDFFDLLFSPSFLLSLGWH